MERTLTTLRAGLAAALLLSGMAAAQATTPDFDREAPAPGAILQNLAAAAAAMPAPPAAASASAPAAEAVKVPALPAGKANQKFAKPFREAFLNASKRLETPKCAAFYGEGAAAKFEGAEYRFIPMGAPRMNKDDLPSVVGAATHNEASPALVTINSEGPFVRQTMLVSGASGFRTIDMGTNLRGADFGALLLLHELGHVVGKFGPDAHDSKLNRSYTESVLKACFR
ncbi:MAG TPA: hypothetical protein VN915_14445 [Elusimicrobiota bacterium]|nr:hypothetical protein [Elusimicrobiota bacterium]